MARKAFWGKAIGGIAVAAAAGAIAVAVPAAGATGGQAIPAGQPVSVGTSVASAPTVACDRLRENNERRQAVLTRLQGDANTRGSIAWLTARAAAATASGDTSRATLYTDKAALRSVLVDPLMKVEADLAAMIKVHCG